MSKKIYFDAGHGRNTAGKRAPSGVVKEREWFFNNEVALGFESRMKQYNGVQLFRTDDRTGNRDVPLGERTGSAIKGNADIYISFHHNANTGVWGSWTGTETYTYLGSLPQSEKLAKLVNDAMVKVYGLRNRGLKKKNLHITRETSRKGITSVLVEGAFMDSTIDIKKLRNNTLLRAVGSAIADAVAVYLKVKLKSTSSTASPSKPSTKPASSNLYRVRKSWADAKTQKGAYTSLANAKSSADKNKGYKVYDSNGKLVYTPKVASKPVPAKPTKPKPVLKQGSSGSAVKELQTLLNAKGGYGIAVDGNFGPATNKAVRDFQSKQKIGVDGSVGSITWGKLNSASAHKTKEYVVLPASAKSWATYKLNVQPVAKNSDWSLSPSKFGGLKYEVLGKPYANVVTIKTSNGKRNIYVHPKNTSAKIVKE